MSSQSAQGSTTSPSSTVSVNPSPGSAPATSKRPKGPKLAPSPELLFRQVHPQYYLKGELDEAAFRLSSSDQGLLSISLESLTTAKDAYELHTLVKGLKSVGVWAVSVQECDAAGLGAYSDPTQKPEERWDDPAHGSIDFQGNPKPDERLKRKKLLEYAEDRGPVYMPP